MYHQVRWATSGSPGFIQNATTASATVTTENGTAMPRRRERITFERPSGRTNSLSKLSR